jgi:hypothetical protein
VFALQPPSKLQLRERAGRWRAALPFTANWGAEEGNRWTVPLGLGITHTIGLQPASDPTSALSYYYNTSSRPKGRGAPSQLRSAITLLYPK